MEKIIGEKKKKLGQQGKNIKKETKGKKRSKEVRRSVCGCQAPGSSRPEHQVSRLGPTVLQRTEPVGCLWVCLAGKGAGEKVSGCTQPAARESRLSGAPALLSGVSSAEWTRRAGSGFLLHLCLEFSRSHPHHASMSWANRRCAVGAQSPVPRCVYPLLQSGKRGHTLILIWGLVAPVQVSPWAAW